MSSDPDPPSPLATYDKRGLRRAGFTPLIVALTAQGLTPGDIAARLSEEYGTTVSAQSVSAVLAQAGPIDSLAVSAAQQEYAELHQIALEQLNDMRAEYALLSKVKTGNEDAKKMAAITARLEMLQRYFIQWWDRVGKFHFRADNVSLTANITQVSMTQALDEVKGDPKRAAAVLAKLRGEEGGGA